MFMDWIAWIRGSLSAALQWFEGHPGTAGWLEAVGSVSAILFVYLFALLQSRRFRSTRTPIASGERKGLR